ncbi:MAG: hypothetical protein KA140_07825 [Caldisericia bacterium]|nr:hypothetical protein [Caldisericia bacterium]
MKDKIVPISIAVVILLVGVLLMVMNLMNVPLTFDKIWPAIPIVIGLLMLLRVNADYGVVFPSIIMIGVGAIFYIDNLQLLGAGINMGQLWPLFPIVVGLAFVALYAFKPHDWGVLIPAAACLITGSVFMSMQQMKNIMIFIIAPVIIIVGILMIVTSLRKPGQIDGTKNDGRSEKTL